MKDSSRASSPLTKWTAPSKDAHNDEESLPLYEETLGSHSQPTLPSKDATPIQVRDFLYQILVSRHGLDDASARETASRWKLGGGAELRDYPMSMYISIFGAEGSWLILRTVYLMIAEEDRPAREKSLRNLHIVCGAILAALLIPISVLIFTDSRPLIIIPFFGICIDVMLWMIHLGMLRTKNEDFVESRMKWFKAPEASVSTPPGFVRGDERQ